MANFFVTMFSVIIAFYTGYVLVLIPMQKTLGMSKKAIFIFLSGVTLYLSVGFFICVLFLELNTQVVTSLKGLLGIPPLVLLAWLCRKRIWQTVFCIAVATLCGTISPGIGIFVSINFFADSAFQILAETIVTFVTALITLPPLLILLKRFCENNKIQNTSVWKFIWLLPTVLFLLIVLTGNSFLVTDIESFGFIIIRILIYATLLLTCYLLETGMRQVSEAEAAKSEAAEIAAENAALEKLNRMRSDLIETISHESRTPLAVLSSYAGLVAKELKKSGVDEQISADLDTISSEAVHVGNLIDNMQKLSQQKEVTIKHARLDAGDVIKQTARLYEHILQRGGVNLSVDIPENLPPVFGNPKELTQVMFNLLQNAKNHTEHGQVTIAAKAEKNFIVITVADSGTGISPELLPLIFERGVTGRNGSGIGLSVCKEIIENHGGEVSISNEKNGTLVKIILPIYTEGCENEK